MGAIASSAGKGIERLFDYGAALGVLLLVAIGMGYAVRYLLHRCDDRFDQALARHEEMTKYVAGVLERNTQAHTEYMTSLREWRRNRA